MYTDEQMKAYENRHSKSWLWKGAFVLIVFLALGLVFVMIAKPKRDYTPLAEVPLVDGRILQIEAVTYGTNHVVGDKSLILERFGPWLPNRVCDFLETKVPQSSMESERPSLVVWVNAIDPVTRTNVDCQGIRVEFVSKEGDLFGQSDRFVHGFARTMFWRAGHQFDSFPRSEEELTLRITPWKTNVTATVSFPNPHVVTPESWDGNPPPPRKTIGEHEIVLEELVERTNGIPRTYWETPTRYWQPQWQLLSNGEPVAGWQPPEWEAEDPMGNHGQFLGIHQKVLRYHVSFYPKVMNTAATEIIAELPKLEISATLTNILWNLTNQIKGKELMTIGFLASRVNVFSEGQYHANPPMTFGPVSGGAPSGWTSRSRRTSPVNIERWYGHYTDRPVIYLRSTEFDPKQVAVRLRDENGVLWPTKLGPQGTPDGVMPFLVDLPEGAKELQPEIVLLKPLEAEFIVKTPPVPEK